VDADPFEPAGVRIHEHRRRHPVVGLGDESQVQNALETIRDHIVTGLPS
jgi:hypothetical protein